MFFADPVAAFANIGRALRPGGRLVLLTWQGRDRNEWATAIPEALAADGPPLRPAGAADAFSLADPAVTQGVLAAAGFAEARLADVHEPVSYGEDVEAALRATLGLYCPDDVLADLGPAGTGPALPRLRATLAAHATDDGVLFDSRAWLVTATRAPA
jgi:SAM-dependent methyltransferase